MNSDTIEVEAIASCISKQICHEKSVRILWIWKFIALILPIFTICLGSYGKAHVIFVNVFLLPSAYIFIAFYSYWWPKKSIYLFIPKFVLSYVTISTSCLLISIYNICIIPQFKINSFENFFFYLGLWLLWIFSNRTNTKLFRNLSCINQCDSIYVSCIESTSYISYWLGVKITNKNRSAYLLSLASVLFVLAYGSYLTITSICVPAEYVWFNIPFLLPRTCMNAFSTYRNSLASSGSLLSLFLVAAFGWTLLHQLLCMFCNSFQPRLA